MTTTFDHSYRRTVRALFLCGHLALGGILFVPLVGLLLNSVFGLTALHFLVAWQCIHAIPIIVSFVFLPMPPLQRLPFATRDNIKDYLLREYGGKAIAVNVLFWLLVYWIFRIADSDSYWMSGGLLPSSSFTSSIRFMSFSGHDFDRAIRPPTYLDFDLHLPPPISFGCVVDHRNPCNRRRTTARRRYRQDLLL